LAAEGDLAAAEALLLACLQSRPDWLDGHKCLATMRWTAGRRSDFLDSYRDACRTQPRHVPLRLAWFYAVATVRDWPAAAEVLDEGEAVLGDSQPFRLARLYLACETLAHGAAGTLLGQTAAVRDAGVDLCRMRYYLRTGQLAEADAAGARLCRTPAARMAWPYRALIWRLQRDPRAEWLDGEPPRVQSVELDFPAVALAELATLLRQLHTASAPYIEQSVRGGTQTDRPLFFRHEPIIQRLRQQVVSAVGQYVDALPAADAAHPLLGVRRDAPVLFSGSWSVRLQSQGFHVSHTHPMGWISSALYVSLPDASQLGPAPAGWIGFGAPPPELGLSLSPCLRVEPKPGRLLLFPSTLWHSTEPFADGERLVVAFDVAVPRR
jgi:Putative 2OG-Fe(II) oxygenase